MYIPFFKHGPKGGGGLDGAVNVAVCLESVYDRHLISTL